MAEDCTGEIPAGPGRSKASSSKWERCNGTGQGSPTGCISLIDPFSEYK